VFNIEDQTMTATVAELIVSILQKAGAKRCYGVPGDTLNHVGDALRKSDIRFVHVRHEEVGAFAAASRRIRRRHHHRDQFQAEDRLGRGSRWRHRAVITLDGKYLPARP
jgi:hypothetical protein